MIKVKVGETRRVPITPQKVEEAEICVGEKMVIKGRDGVSPTIEIEGIPNGHRVTITGADGPKSFDVLNGEKGEAGVYSAGDGISITEKTISNTGVTNIRMNGTIKGAGDVDLGNVITEHQSLEDLGIGRASNSDINNLFN